MSKIAATVVAPIRYFVTTAKMALMAIVRWPLRAGLTAVGIMVGVLAVTVTMALGDGARRKVTEKIDNLGSNALLIRPKARATSGAKSDSRVAALTEADERAIAREVTSVKYSAPLLISREQMVFQNSNANVELIGTTRDFFPIRAWLPRSGQIWSEQAAKTGMRVCLIGTTVQEELFGNIDPVGRVVRLGRYPFRVIGVMAPKGQDPFGRDEDARVILPLSTARSKLRQTKFGQVDAILLSAKSKETTEQVKKSTIRLLRARHGQAEGAANDFSIRSQEEFGEVQDRIISLLNMLLVSIALVSLVVGGVGIMNIMLVSVSERTKEIGIRLAIGARERDILIQFLVEAVVLSVCGGLAGALVSAGLIIALAERLDLPMQVSLPGLLLALATSMTIGVVFGFIPARRAARLDPIEALRQE